MQVPGRGAGGVVGLLVSNHNGSSCARLARFVFLTQDSTEGSGSPHVWGARIRTTTRREQVCLDLRQPFEKCPLATVSDLAVFEKARVGGILQNPL